MLARYRSRKVGFEFGALRHLMGPEDTSESIARELKVHAQAGGSTASLADAVLAATVRNRGGVLYAFDEDFRHLGLRQESTGRWTRA